MCQYELWVNMNYEWGDRQTHRHTNRHINTMNRPGLGTNRKKKKILHHKRNDKKTPHKKKIKNRKKEERTNLRKT